jgi:hypothetical protein
MRSSWFAVISHMAKALLSGAHPAKPHKVGRVQCLHTRPTWGPLEAHFAGVAFLHLRQLASTLFKKKTHTHTTANTLWLDLITKVGFYLWGSSSKTYSLVANISRDQIPRFKKNGPFETKSRHMLERFTFPSS